MKRYMLALALTAGLALPAPGGAQNTSDVSQKDVDAAAISIARYCKILVQRMDGLINEEWATQDLAALASVWDALSCHQLFGFDPEPAQGKDNGERRLRWIVR